MESTIGQSPTPSLIIGPKQEAWLKALESGEYIQGRDALYDGVGHCCLGVACLLQRKVFKKTKLGHWLCEKETGTLPDSVAAELKMYSKAGAFPVSVVSGNITVTTLTGLNDTLKWNLKQIAEFIRRHPHWFFTEAA